MGTAGSPLEGGPSRGWLPQREREEGGKHTVYVCGSGPSFFKNISSQRGEHLSVSVVGYAGFCGIAGMFLQAPHFSASENLNTASLASVWELALL